MTKYHELQVESNKSRTRVGRGISAGRGKTAGRGTKGQKSRTGKKLRATFMGGQRELVRAIPKARGFKSLRKPAQAVYLEDLNSLKAKSVDNFVLAEAGLVADPYHKVKIITRGEIKKALNIKVQAMSESSVAAVKKAGGTFEKVDVPLRQSRKPQKTEKAEK